MENIQKIDQLVSKAGCSYEDAKAALEACGWDMIDAIVSLEREGKVKKVNEEESGMAVQYAEEPVEVVPEVSADEIEGDYSRKITYSFDGASEDRGDAGSSRKAAGARRGHKLWNRIRSILMNNRMIIIKSNGKQIADLPIVVPVIALIAFFWATLIIAALAMLFGYRFHFEGEDLGKTNINNTMDKATDYAEKVKNDLANKANERKNTDN